MLMYAFRIRQLLTYAIRYQYLAQVSVASRNDSLRIGRLLVLKTYYNPPIQAVPRSI